MDLEFDPFVGAFEFTGDGMTYPLRDVGLGRALMNLSKPSSPIPTSGLVLQLDATKASSFTLTGSRIDGWADQSGNGNDFGTSFGGTGFNPTYNATLIGGKGAAVFNNSILQSASNLSAVNRNLYTAIFVVKSTSKASLCLFGDHTHLSALAGNSMGRKMGPNSWFGCAHGYPINTLVVNGVRNNGGTIHHLLNGTLYPNYYLGQNMATSQTLGAALLCYGPSSAAWIGDIQYVLLWNRALSDAEMAQVSAYLQATFGVVTDPLQANPNVNVVFDGNSIIYGYGLQTGTGWASEAMYALGYSDYDFKNIGIPGQNTAQCVAAFSTRAAPLLISSLGAAGNIYFLQEITNSLINRAQTTSQVQTQITSYVTAVHALGARCIVATCLPCNNGGAHFEEDRQTVNAWITGGGSGADVIADFGGDATIGASGAETNTSLFPDGTHPSDSANVTYLKPIAKAAIQAAMA